MSLNRLRKKIKKATPKTLDQILKLFNFYKIVISSTQQMCIVVGCRLAGGARFES